MAGTKSIMRNLKREDDAVDRNTKASEGELVGVKDVVVSGGEEEMDITAARDVIFHQHPAQPTKPTDTTPAPAPAPAASSGLGTMGVIGVVAASMLGGAGIGAAVPLAIDYFTKPAMVDTDTNTNYELVIPKAQP